MTSPQDPPVRNKQKRRRTKKLAEWRAKKAVSTTATSPAAKPAAKKAAEKPAAKAEKAPAKK